MSELEGLPPGVTETMNLLAFFSVDARMVWDAPSHAPEREGTVYVPWVEGDEYDEVAEEEGALATRHAIGCGFARCRAAQGGVDRSNHGRVADPAMGRHSGGACCPCDCE